MGIFSGFQRWAPFQRAVKSSAAGPAIAAWMVNQAVWTPRDYATLADEGYVKNPIGQRCVKMIASAASAIPMFLTDAGGKEVEKHPLLDLLRRPAPLVGGQALFEALVAHLLLAGNAYLEGVGPNDTAPPRELYAHRPDRMKVIMGPYGLPQGYVYTANGLTKRWDVDPITGAGPILHIKEFHPLDDSYGLSRVEPAGYGFDRHNEGSKHNMALLQSGARPSGALIFKPVTVNGQVQSAPQEIIDKAEARLNDRHVGAAKAGKPLVLSGDVDWKEMGLSPKDMDFAAGMESAARDICSALGVPHLLVVPGSSTYNNVIEARLQLYEDTVLPIAGRVLDALNGWLTPQFGDGLRLEHDLDEIPALEPRREAKRKSTVELLDKGVIDADEARDALQYAPRGANSVKKVDAAVLTALVGAAEKDSALFESLFRYLTSVGLVAPGTTPEQLLASARALIDDGADQVDANPDTPTVVPAKEGV